jgi:hypothetical protein
MNNAEGNSFRPIEKVKIFASERANNNGLKGPRLRKKFNLRGKYGQ